MVSKHRRSLGPAFENNTRAHLGPMLPKRSWINQELTGVIPRQKLKEMIRNLMARCFSIYKTKTKAQYRVFFGDPNAKKFRIKFSGIQTKTNRRNVKERAL